MQRWPGSWPLPTKCIPTWPPLIVLARTTGRRLSAVLGLHWADIDFSRGMIRWRPENDKLRKTWVVPAPPAALEALTHFRTAHPGVGEVPVFPHPRQKRHPGQPVTRHLAGYWLNQAYDLSKVPKSEGTLWHAFRRLWATERKHLSVKDVAAAGGWNDVTTLLKCYQQPDEETLRAVVEYQSQKPRAAKPRKVKA
jgi:integrase